MPGTLNPGVYIEESPSGVRTIDGVPTSITAFVGYTIDGELDQPVDVYSFADFERNHGGLHRDSAVSYAVSQFFLNGGTHAIVVRVAGAGANDLIGATETQGLRALNDVDLFNILSIPDTFDLPESEGLTVIQSGIELCEKRRAFYIVDPPSSQTLTGIAAWASGIQHRNAATYFPGVLIADPRNGLPPRPMAPSGTLAGVYARTDNERGIWKAPAGMAATLQGLAGLPVVMNDTENASLNPRGVNALRVFPPHGPVAWGARTLKGADAHADEYRYVPVRRLALFLEESILRGTQWASIEPNDEPLWAQIRLNVGAFMQHLFRQGAFQGTTPRDAYLVRCDATTTTQADVDNGVVNIMVGFAPLKPAQFVVIELQQTAGQVPA
jgi:phage tail sheath protein FI